MNFPTSYSDILNRLNQIDPIRYGQTRNYLNGAVSYLSPYIARGVLSTKQILDHVLDRGYAPKQMEKFIQELAWRDYWQLVWKHKKEQINYDLLQTQPDVNATGIPESLLHHTTVIHAIDQGVMNLYESGYVHNHVRMYIAALACNMAKCHWKIPAQWMYYHLLDGDWGSNALSWQWVCASNSKKKYRANQENINTYCATLQHGTFLDRSYEDLERMEVPEELNIIIQPELNSTWPRTTKPILNVGKATCVYTYYNLDPNWHSKEDVNRILLIEPSLFSVYPVSEKCMQFVTQLAQELIPGIQLWVAEFSELQHALTGTIYFKEHPLNNFQGQEEQRDWMTSIQQYYPSFSSFWKHAKKELAL